MRPPLPAPLRPYSAGTETAQRHADQGTQNQERKIKMEEVGASSWGKLSKSYSPGVEETQRSLLKFLVIFRSCHLITDLLLVCSYTISVQ